MMKKQIVFAMVMMGCAVNGVFADQVKNDGNAFKINKYDSDHAQDLRNGIPSTTTINGHDVWRLLNRFAKINPENISVVNELKDGAFSNPKDLDDFNNRTLDWCSFYLRLHGEEFVNKRYDAHYVSLAKSLDNKTCYLCMYGDKQVIVTNGNGTPQNVCDRLNPAIQKTKRADSIQEQAIENALMTSRAYAFKKAQSAGK